MRRARDDAHGSRSRSVAVEGQQDVDELPVIFVEHLLGRAAESGEQIPILAAIVRSCGYAGATMVSTKGPEDGDKWFAAHLNSVGYA